MLNTVVSFVRKRYPYLLGFVSLKLEYIISTDRPGISTTGFLGLFAIWMYYSWMSKK